MKGATPVKGNIRSRFLLLIGIMVVFLGGGFLLGRAYEQSLHNGGLVDTSIFNPFKSTGPGVAAASAAVAVAGIIPPKEIKVQVQSGLDPVVTAVPKVTGEVKAPSPAATSFPEGGANFDAGPVSIEKICNDLCPKAKNGQCDDGRSPNFGGQSYANVTCDLGTDCTDCGAWTPDTPVNWGKTGKGPIALLMSKNIEVRVSNTTTLKSFRFAYTDPKKDVDVSGGLTNGGLFEPAITKIFYRIFNKRCDLGGGKRALFVDVGANFGWYSVFVSSLGCRVHAFEPVPQFRAFLEYNLHVNSLMPLVTVHTNIVSHESGKEMEMVVPTRGIWGTAGIGGHNIDNAIVESENTKIKVRSERLEDLVSEDALLIKADVEGWEWSVIQGAMKYLQKYKVENIIMEYSPGVPERNKHYEYSINTVQMLMDILDSGYKIGHIGYPWIGNVSGSFMWGGDIPFMEEVLMGNLKYDMEDVNKFKDGTIGCPVEPELLKFWLGCGALPEDSSPRSFRSVLGHNTNILCSKNPDILKTNSVTGLMALDAPQTKYHTNEETNGHGSGYRPCKYLIPLVQVRHRCPCTNKTICGAEEEVVLRLSAEGKIGSNYVLPGV